MQLKDTNGNIMHCRYIDTSYIFHEVLLIKLCCVQMTKTFLFYKVCFVFLFSIGKVIEGLDMTQN